MTIKKCSTCGADIYSGDLREHQLERYRNEYVYLKSEKKPSRGIFFTTKSWVGAIHVCPECGNVSTEELDERMKHMSELKGVYGGH